MKNEDDITFIMEKAILCQEKISMVHESVSWLEMEIDDAATDFDDLQNGFYDHLDELEKQKIRVKINKRIKHLFNKNRMESKLLDSLESEMEDIDLLFERLTRAKKEE
tara:strand:- start:2424 stop:2747 length:324 start_codon:yes stop_codon:yes gene_type:complete